MADIDYSTEEWRDIPGWEGLYQASSMGRVRSIPRFKQHKSPYGRWYEQPLKGRILKDARGYNGYRVVALSDARTGRRPTSQRVHRLICMTFHPNPMNKPEVAHNDGSRTNNAASNLRWATREENLADVKIHREQRSALAREVCHF